MHKPNSKQKIQQVVLLQLQDNAVIHPRLSSNQLLLWLINCSLVKDRVSLSAEATSNNSKCLHLHRFQPLHSLLVIQKARDRVEEQLVKISLPHLQESVDGTLEARKEITSSSSLWRCSRIKISFSLIQLLRQFYKHKIQCHGHQLVKHRLRLHNFLLVNKILKTQPVEPQVAFRSKGPKILSQRRMKIAPTRSKSLKLNKTVLALVIIKVVVLRLLVL